MEHKHLAHGKNEKFENPKKQSLQSQGKPPVTWAFVVKREKSKSPSDWGYKRQLERWFSKKDVEVKRVVPISLSTYYGKRRGEGLIMGVSEAHWGGKKGKPSN